MNPDPKQSSRNHRLEIAILIAIVLVAVIPFSNRAVFADENLYLNLARSALENPLFPADTPKQFFGNLWPNNAGHTHPPAIEYYLAAVLGLLGRFREIPFRLAFAVFPIMAVLAFYALARRFTAEPFFVSALLAVSPAFFVTAPTLMMDIPIIALLLAGLAFYFRGWLVPAAIGFTLAVGAGYAALVPLACLGVIMLLSKRPWKEVACVAAAPAVLLLWLLAMTAHFGEFPLTSALTYLARQGIAEKTTAQLLSTRVVSVIVNTLATLSFLGGVLVFPGMIRLKKKSSLLATLGLCLVLSFLAPMPSLLYRAWFIVLASCGVMLLAAFFGAASRTMRSGGNGGEPILILWAPAALLFFIVVGEWIGARYLLLAMPAIYLIVFRESSRSDLIATIVPTFVLSLVLSYADTTFVNSYRAWVVDNVLRLQQQGFRVWSASESGFRFYLEQAGSSTLLVDDRRPAGGDIIIRQNMYDYNLGESIEVVLADLQQFPLDGPFPVRTYGPLSHAGFWGSHFGLAPFVLSSEPYDVIRATQVNPLVAHLPQGSTNPEEVPVFGTAGRPLFRLAQRERVFPMRIPKGIQIQYDLVGGTGTAEETAEGLRLVNNGSTPIDWFRLRFMPMQWMGSQ